MASRQARGALQRRFGWRPRFSGVRLLDPARVLCPPRRRPATNRVAPRQDVTHRRILGCMC